MAVECERQPRDLWSNGQSLASFCGVCSNCVRIASAANLEEVVELAVAAREELRETDKKETRVLVQPHPDVLIIPPDPPQLLIKMGQVHTVIERSQRHPNQGEYRIFIFTSAKFMKEAANSLLKVLEEPSPFAHFFLLAETPGELLPTIRSRCALFRLHPIERESIDALLAKERPTWSPQQRELVARLTEGSVGRALAFDLAAYQAARADALLLLSQALEANDHGALFKATETYRGGADGQQKTIGLLRGTASLLEDMMLLQHGADDLVRNRDIQPQLARLAGQVSFDWLDSALQGLSSVEGGMRRNLLRNLSLDAFAARLENA
jgi:DNA polymerase-3 subunit delta'